MVNNYNTTSHSKYLLQCHLVFSTKYRKKILNGALSEDCKIGNGRNSSSTLKG